MLASSTYYLNELIRLRGWLGRLGFPPEGTAALAWWRLGTLLSPLLRLLGLMSPRALHSATQAKTLVHEARRLEEAVLALLDRPLVEGESLEAGIQPIYTCVETMCGCVATVKGSPWWRIGTWIRVLLRGLGPMPESFAREEDQAKAVADEIRSWRSRREMYLCGGRPPGGEPGAADPIEAGESLFDKQVNHLLQDSSSKLLRITLQDNVSAIAGYVAGGGAPSPPLVSVIMPVYNRAEVLCDAICSVREQTWSHWELLVCDDGSEDNTREIVTGIGDRRIRYLQLPHGGAARARNCGVAAARGEYIAYLDSDNIWHPAFVEVMIGELERNEGRYTAYAKYLDVVMQADGTYRAHGFKPLDFDYEALCRENFVDLNSLVHRTCLFRALGGFTESLPNHQDWDLVLKYFYSQDPLYVDAYMTLYRRNARWGQLTDDRKGHVSSRRIVEANLKRYYEEGLPFTHAEVGRRAVSIVCWDTGVASASRACRIAEALSRSGQFAVQLVRVRSAEQDATPLSRWEVAGVETLELVGAFPEIDSILAKPNSGIRGTVIYCIRSTPSDIHLGHWEPVDEERSSPLRDARVACRTELGLSSDERLLLFAGVAETDENRIIWAEELQLGLSEPCCIVNLEPCGEDERLRLCAAADIIILGGHIAAQVQDPSLARLFVEAAAMGVPVIADQVQALHDWAKQGYLTTVDVSDADALQKTIWDLLSHPKRMRALGLRSRSLFLRQFSYRAVGIRTDLLFHRLAEHQGRTCVVDEALSPSWPTPGPDQPHPDISD